MPEAQHKMGILLLKFNSTRKSQSAQTKVANGFHGDTLQLGKVSIAGTNSSYRKVRDV